MKQKLDTYHLDRCIGFWNEKVVSNVFTYMLCWLLIVFTVLMLTRSVLSQFGYWENVRPINVLLASMVFAFPSALIVEGTVLWDFKNDKARCKVCIVRKVYYHLHGVEGEITYEKEHIGARRSFYLSKYFRSTCQKCKSIYYKKARGIEL